MSVSRLALVLFFVCFCTSSDASTVLDFWHSYTDRPSGKTHYSFHVSDHKRGLFMGPCGFSTTQIQWQYNLDLAGPGPAYSGTAISMSDFDTKPVPVRSGTILIDAKCKNATINLEILRRGRRMQFAGNGKHRIHGID